MIIADSTTRYVVYAIAGAIVMALYVAFIVVSVAKAKILARYPSLMCPKDDDTS